MEDCIFCQIASGKADAEVVYQDEKVVAFKDINPSAPVHILVIPREHIPSLNELESEHRELIGHMALVMKDLAQQLNISESGYRIVNNCGSDGGQIVYHLHFHLLGGKALGGRLVQNQ